MKNRLGETVYLSGFNHYLRSNIKALRAGIAVVDAAPSIFELPEKDAALAITATAATDQITVTFNATLDWCKETGGHMFLLGGEPQNPQRNFFKGPYKNAGQFDGNTGVPIVSPQTANSPYPLSAGQRIWIAVRIMRADGRLSEEFRANCFCGA
jgi:hypothetical protein